MEYTIGDHQKTVKDLTRSVVVSPSFLESRYPFYDYIIPDGYRPDHVSYQQYGTTRHFWIILIVNDIRDIWEEWPLSTYEFTRYVSAKYGSIETSKTMVHEYREIETDEIIDEETRQEIGADKVKTIYKFDYEFETNENKRDIKLVNRAYLSKIREELENLFD